MGRDESAAHNRGIILLVTGLPNLARGTTSTVGATAAVLGVANLLRAREERQRTKRNMSDGSGTT
jgi:hypothetical protein